MEIVIKLFTAVFVAIAEFLKLNQTGKRVVAIADMYDEMSSILDPHGINRVLIMWYHNSGGVLTTDKPLYVTCVHEVKLDEIDSVKRKYKGLEMDFNYAKMMKDIYVNKSVELHQEHMKKSLLKKIFEDEGVTKSKMFYIKNNKKGLWFVAFRTSNEYYDFNTDTVEMQSVLSNIKRTLK